jgi:hypothetical protein
VSETNAQSSIRRTPVSRDEMARLLRKLLSKGHSLSDISRKTGREIQWLDELLKEFPDVVS